jgi:hypothetical protein
MTVELEYKSALQASASSIWATERFFLQEKMVVINLKVQNAGQSEKMQKNLSRCFSLWGVGFRVVP